MVAFWVEIGGFSWLFSGCFMAAASMLMVAGNGGSLARFRQNKKMKRKLIFFRFLILKCPSFNYGDKDYIHIEI